MNAVKPASQVVYEMTDESVDAVAQLQRLLEA